MPDIVADRYALVDATSRQGGLSVVRQAMDLRTGERVAVKLLSSSRDEILQKTFERETSTLRSLDHPNIIRLTDAGTDQDGTFFLVLEWIESSLAQLLADGQSYEWDELRSLIAVPLASALSYAHLKNIEHRDIKPGNILLREDGAPLLADFGIAKLRNHLGASEMTVAGFRSVPYAPPEHDTSIPFVRDVYSLGVLLIQALSTERIRDFPDIAPALDALHVPSGIRALLRRCVSTDRTERPANGSVLENELTQEVQKIARGGNQNRVKIPLLLTGAVRRSLEEARKPGDDRRAEAVAGDDLAKEVYGEYRFDHDNQRADRETVFIVGQSWRWTLKLQSNGQGYAAVGARELEYEAVEAVRRRAVQLANIGTWAVGPAVNPSAATRVSEAIQRALDDHEEERAARRYEAGHQIDDLFEGWQRLLRAQEEVARGDLKPIRYTECSVSGKIGEFVVSDLGDSSLVGSEMQIVVEESGRRVARGEVLGQDAGKLTIRSVQALKGLPKKGLLSLHLGPTQIALDRQRAAVLSVRDGTCARPSLRELLVDPSSSAAPREVSIDHWRNELDESKHKAVCAAAGAEDFLVVSGPPGTGKTTFIAETVEQLLEKNPDARILIVSQTHVAVDNALERLEAGGTRGIVRLGTVDDSRVDDRVKHLLLEQQMERWAAEVRKKAEKYLEERASQEGLPTDHLRAALALTQLKKVKEEISAVEAEVERPSREDLGKLSDGVGVLDSVQLQERLDRLSELHDDLLVEARRHLAGDLTLHESISSAEVRDAVTLLLGETEAGQSLLRLLSLQAEWLQRVASDENLSSAFLQTSRVIAGTCIGFLRHPAVRDLEIDVCILDEASKATATEALVPMARAKRWILIGDTNQLPPMDEEVLRLPDLMEEHDLSRQFVEETLFQRLSTLLPQHSHFELNEQYRMIRPIGDLISECFYSGRLRSPQNTELTGYNLFGKPVLWLDTVSLGSQRREAASDGASSYANRAEAQAVIARLRTFEKAVEKGHLVSPSQDRKISVLLIAPYRSQIEELQRRIASIRLANLDVDIQTVDAVQGRESDLVIFSVTRSNSQARMGFLGEEYWRRINVALSRARFGLTIVGDSEFCRSAPGALRQVVFYIESNREDCELRSVEL